MKRFGLFLLKNNIHLMTLVFVGFAIWAACCWSELLLIQKLVMGMFACIIVHFTERQDHIHSCFRTLIIK